MPVPEYSWWPRSSWPIPDGAAVPGRVAIAVAGVAAFGAAFWDPGTWSIGYLLVGVAVFTAAFGAAGRRPTMGETAYIAATLALLAVPAVRDAGWLAGLCVAASWGTGWLACAGGRTWTSLVLGSLVAWFLPIRVARWLWRGGEHMARSDVARSRSTARTIGVLALTAAIVLIFAVLFAGADQVFAGLLADLVPSVHTPAGPWMVSLLLAAGFALGVSYLLAVRPHFDLLAPKPGRTVRRWEWIVPIAALDVLFAAFVGVQIAVLFGGNNHVLETEGLTYAEYARQGFWQLLAVSALTLLVLAVAARTANYGTRRDRTIVRTLGGLLCALSIVVVASAIHRMWVYEQAYGFTALRVLVTAVELWLGAVFVLVAVAGIRLRREARWLPRSVLAAGVFTLLALAAINPDRFIADRNIGHFAENGRIDLEYLGDLSADAAPALLRLPAEQRDCALRSVVSEVDDESWTRYNYGRARARDLIADIPADTVSDCSVDRR